VTAGDTPKLLSEWRTGEHGVHRNHFTGGRYVHVTASRRGFDGNIYVILDIADPRRPEEVAMWFLPEQYAAGRAGNPTGAGREVRFGLNGFIIARDSEKEAKEVLREIIEKANRPAVEGFRGAVQQAGNSTGDKKGMWADSSFEDLVQYNDGFRTQLIGTPEQIAERIAGYRKRGTDLILGGFLHFQEEIEYFGANVLPLVREIEESEDNSRDAPVLVSA